jgi:ribosome biogenesis GTPase
MDEKETSKGIVIRAQAGIYYVKTTDQVIECTLRGKIKHELRTDEHRFLYADPVSVGDEVAITIAEGDKGAIEEIMPRKSKISRMASGTAPIEQIIVANADYMVMLMSAKMPNFKPRLLDRLLIVAEAGDLEPIVLINKIDLINDKEKDRLFEETHIYSEIGYKIFYISALNKIGIDEVIDVMKGKMSAMIGHSGTGKTTLLNAIQPGLGLKTREIGAKTKRGKHTTTSVRLYELDFGGYIVDTPGIREVGLWDVWKSELDQYFREMGPYVSKCKFYDCSHISEPGCVIKEAVAQGKISRSRYESYTKLRLGKARDDSE